MCRLSKPKSFPPSTPVREKFAAENEGDEFSYENNFFSPTHKLRANIIMASDTIAMAKFNCIQLCSYIAREEKEERKFTVLDFNK